VAVGVGVPYISWFHTNWESDRSRRTARFAAFVLITAWFVGRPAAVVIADRARRHVVLHQPSDEGISVIVPCHNASRKIEALVETVLLQDYRPLEMILVENNSTDETWDVLLRLEREHPEIRVFWIPPKPGEYAASVALNVAVERATYPVILRIDDDTVLAPGAIRAAMIAIAPETHTAVACNLRVSNPNQTLWTRLQTVEYMLAMELDRRSQALLQTVLICSGGMQVFRRDLIIEHDGYVVTPRVVSEDFDMTLKAHRAGHVTVAPEALGYTEVPGTLRQLLKQRHRWAICGTVSLWLHRRGICNADYWFGGLVGFAGLPMRVVLFLRDVLPVAFVLDAAFLLHGDLGWFFTLAAARMLLHASQIAVLLPALRSRQGVRNVPLIPFFTLIYGPLMLATRFFGTLAGIGHVYVQREKLRDIELSSQREPRQHVTQALVPDVALQR